MTEKQKDCIIEIQDLLISINEVVKKYDLTDEFLSVIAIGFLDLDSSYVDEDGDERADMSLLSTFSVADEDELDDMLSYCLEAYRADAKDNEPKEGTIDWWLKNFGGDDSLN
jgi:hypothetical protein